MSVHYMSREMRSNFWHLYADIFWFGMVAGSTMTFMSVFAVRQGASSFQISLLSSGPAVVSLLFSMPFGRWLEGRHLVKTTFWSSIFHRLGYLALVPLPALAIAMHQVWGVVLTTILMSVPGTLLAISFNAMFADLVPSEWRAQVVGRRNALLALTMTTVSLLCGWILDWIVFPFNYQIVFLIGGIGALLSSYHLAKLRLPSEPPVRVGQLMYNLAKPGLLRFIDGFRMPVGLRYLTRTQGKSLFRLDLLKGSFGSFMLAYFLFYTFQYIAIPIFPVYFVRELNLTDGQISLGNALFYGMMLVASIQLSRVNARFGFRGTLVLGSLVYGMYPLLMGLAQGATLYWIASLVGGATWAITNGGLVNRLMERVPEDDRPAYMALHNMILNMGILLGSLAGPVFTVWFGLRDALLFDAGLRLFAGLLILFLG